MNDEERQDSFHPSSFSLHPFIVRWAFARFYREFAWTYDAVAAGVSGGQWSQWTLAALPFLRGRVLELGCGTGNIQRALAEQHGHAVGLDLSPQMLRLASAKLKGAGLQTQLLRANAGILPFPSQTFDTLIATFPSEYIVAPETVAEARRVLRPAGQFVILLAAQFHGSTYYRRAIDALYRITLQRPVLAPASLAPPDSIVGQRYRHAGFVVREFWHAVGASGVDLHIIVADVSSR